jgi:murein DD-endopeptidase MepM/ murein hydrolase activator NlpD
MPPTLRFADQLDSAIVVEFPLRGDWTAVHSPGSRIPSHGTDMLGQRFAFDFVRFDWRKGSRSYPTGGLRGLLVGVQTRDCHGWGEPVHAPFEGEVVSASDGLPERARIHVVRELALVLRTALTFRPTPENVRRVMGNHVVLRQGDVWAAFAHLTTGSVAVSVGQTVRTGDVLGRVGHTGNSTAPHLHFQLMDGPDPLVAKGVPCAFRTYEVERNGLWVRVEGGIPLSTERIRFVEGTEATPATEEPSAGALS